MEFTIPTTSKAAAKRVLSKHASTKGAFCEGRNASTCSVVTMQITEDNEVKVTSNYFSSRLSIVDYGIFGRKWGEWIKENV